MPRPELWQDTRYARENVGHVLIRGISRAASVQFEREYPWRPPRP